MSTAVAQEFEYLIRRARKNGDQKLVGLLEAAYQTHLLEEETRPSRVRR